MCAIFGVLDYKGKLESSQRLRMAKALGNAAEVRGTDATGMAFFQSGRLCIQKAPKPAHRMKWRIPAEVRYIMGHTRMTTQGSAEQNQNNHPFPGKVKNQTFALAHNGVLHNDWYLRQMYQLPKTSIETDSYVAVQLIERQKELSFDNLRKMAEVLEGPFTFTILDQDNNLYFIKGSNPLTIYHYPKLGLYIYASTQEILADALKTLGMQKMVHETVLPWPGDILRIDSRGQMEKSTFAVDDPFSAFVSRTQRISPEFRHSRRVRRKAQQEYIQAMKSLAVFNGYEADYVEALLADGYTVAELEDLIYCGRF